MSIGLLVSNKNINFIYKQKLFKLKQNIKTTFTCREAPVQVKPL